MLQRVMSRYFADIFVSQYQKILQGNPFVLCFGKFPVVNKFMDKNAGGKVKIFRRNFFLSQYRKFLQGNPLGCH